MHGTYNDPTRLTWEYYDNLCAFAERMGTRNNPDTAAHIERLRVAVVAALGPRCAPGDAVPGA